MNIISGISRNLELSVIPDDGVRPTSIRARKALFDSLGDFSKAVVLDLFSGSGALALESASRGAELVMMVEHDPKHVACIQENCRRVKNTGYTGEMLILEYDVMSVGSYIRRLPEKPDIIFADPPYAGSAEFFAGLMKNSDFTKFFSGSRLVWEIPDTPGALGKFMNFPEIADAEFRRYGSTIFLLGYVK